MKKNYETPESLMALWNDVIRSNGKIRTYTIGEVWAIVDLLSGVAIDGIPPEKFEVEEKEHWVVVELLYLNSEYETLYFFKSDTGTELS